MMINFQVVQNHVSMENVGIGVFIKPQSKTLSFVEDFAKKYFPVLLVA